MSQIPTFWCKFDFVSNISIPESHSSTQSIDETIEKKSKIETKDWTKSYVETKTLSYNQDDSISYFKTPHFRVRSIVLPTSRIKSISRPRTRPRLRPRPRPSPSPPQRPRPRSRPAFCHMTIIIAFHESNPHILVRD